MLDDDGDGDGHGDVDGDLNGNGLKHGAGRAKVSFANQLFYGMMLV